MGKKIILSLLLLVSVLVSAAGASKAPRIRIAIFQDAPSVTVSIQGGYEIRDAASGVVLYQGRNLKSQIVRGYPDKIVIGQSRAVSARIRIVPKEKAAIFVNDRRFRDTMVFIRKENRNMLVINELDLEDYIRGVVSHEVAPWWPLEILKAQAVIARTYALYHMQFTMQKDFDLTADVYSQVYGGKLAERWRTNRAVDLTRREVLTFQGRLFPTYYHATCAGTTEDASLLWKIDLAPLKGAACDYCKLSPHYHWTARIPLEQIKSKLSERGVKTGGITAIEPQATTPSGRVSELELRGQEGSVRVSAKDFRQALGPNIIRSARFSVTIADGVALFDGFGWGHGVGLCQWGGFFMASKGAQYKDILKFYYPGTEVILQ